MIVLNDRMPYDYGPSACALGTFDGLHVGHQKLIRQMTSLARERNLVSIVCCFDRHPLEVLRGKPPMYLLTEQEKIEKLNMLGVDIMYTQTFTPKFAHQEPEEYVSELQKTLCAQLIVAGENYTFGRYGRGNAALLKEIAGKNNLEVFIIPSVLESGEPVSSTRIRDLITRGEMAQAEKLLALQSE